MQHSVQDTNLYQRINKFFNGELLPIEFIKRRQVRDSINIKQERSEKRDILDH